MPGRRKSTFEGTETLEGNVPDTLRQETGSSAGRGPRAIRKFRRCVRMGLCAQEMSLS